jgi:hypothetical protein
MLSNKKTDIVYKFINIYIIEKNLIKIKLNKQL